MTNAGYVVPKNAQLTATTSLTEVMLRGLRLDFVDYFDGVYVPFVQAREPGVTREQLIDAGQLRSIEGYLRQDPRVVLVGTQDDVILSRAEVLLAAGRIRRAGAPLPDRRALRQHGPARVRALDAGADCSIRRRARELARPRGPGAGHGSRRLRRDPGHQPRHRPTAASSCRPGSRRLDIPLAGLRPLGRHQSCDLQVQRPVRPSTYSCRWSAAYEFVTPDFIETRVTDFFSNLTEFRNATQRAIPGPSRHRRAGGDPLRTQFDRRCCSACSMSRRRWA